MKFSASLFAFAVLTLVAMLAFPPVAHAGGHGVAVQAFAVPQCHAGAVAFGGCNSSVAAFGLPVYQAAPFAAYGTTAIFQARGIHPANAAFFPQVNVQVNDQNRRGFFGRFFRGRGTDVRVRVR